RLSMAGFAACKALSTRFNDTPEKASRPYDINRDGFVMGEGAGVLVLEELEHAKARGAKIYAEIVGYGLSGDAYHITAPSEDGDGAYRCMSAALRNAGLDASDIDYINAHGTSTMADTIELAAVERLVGNAASKIAMSSTKSSIGHLLGAAGAAEAIFSILAIRHNIAPATINLDNPAAETASDLVPNTPRERRIDVALSNSFGVGGTNASLGCGRYGSGRRGQPRGPEFSPYSTIGFVLLYERIGGTRGGTGSGQRHMATTSGARDGPANFERARRPVVPKSPNE